MLEIILSYPFLHVCECSLINVCEILEMHLFWLIFIVFFIKFDVVEILIVSFKLTLLWRLITMEFLQFFTLITAFIEYDVRLLIFYHFLVLFLKVEFPCNFKLLFLFLVFFLQDSHSLKIILRNLIIIN